MTVDIDQESMKEIIELKQKLTTKNIIKVVFGTMVSFGTAGVVIAMMRNPVKAAHGLMKLMMAMGVFTIGCKAGQVAEDYFKETVDTVADAVTDIKQELLTEGEDKDGTTESGRDPKQQQKSAEPAAKGEASAPAVRRSWWSKKKATK